MDHKIKGENNVKEKLCVRYVWSSFSNILYTIFVIWPGILKTLLALAGMCLPIILFPYLTNTKNKKFSYETENKWFIYIEIWVPTILDFIVIYVLGNYLPDRHSFYLVAAINYVVCLFIGFVLGLIIEFIGIKFKILKKQD